MAKAAFNGTFLGDGLVWLGSEYERTAAAVRPMVWSTAAEVPDASPNFVWRVKLAVWARRADAVSLAQALETLAQNLGAAKGDLEIFEDDGVTSLRVYPSCRFDAMRRERGPRESRGDFEDEVAFVFTTSENPE